MKLRIGFVSNSSSSSYLCLGIKDEDVIQKMLIAEKLSKDQDGYYTGEGYGCLVGKDFVYYGGAGEYYIGGLSDDATLELLTAHNLVEAKKLFTKILYAKLGIKVDPKAVELLYGESSSE
jgi:hypothetical protein